MSRALIVDDSKTAQARLRLLLKPYDLEVDLAFSAEEALGYLSYKQPAVIFLDHHMEGMDGLEALKIIKANPATAMIPVIMYTSEKGDVYLGQARALGALDILSKEIIQPSNLHRLMEKLKIAPVSDMGQKSDVEGAKDSAHVKASSTRSAPQSERPGVDELHSQIARLFEIHISDVRQQISENTRFILRNVRSELNKKAKPAVEKETTPEPELPDAEDGSASPWLSSALLCLILLGMALMGLEMYKTRQTIEELGKNDQFLVDGAIQNQEMLTALTEDLDVAQREQREGQGSAAGWISTLNWLANEDFGFGYDEEPFAKVRVDRLGELLLRLQKIGFRGVVELEVAFANVCLDRSKPEALELADTLTPLQDCLYLNDVALDRQAADYLSLDYIQLEQTADSLVSGEIELRMSLRSDGDAPEPEADITRAGEWNERVLRQNRIVIQLRAE